MILPILPAAKSSEGWGCAPAKECGWRGWGCWGGRGSSGCRGGCGEQGGCGGRGQGGGGGNEGDNKGGDEGYGRGGDEGEGARPARPGQSTTPQGRSPARLT